MPTTDFEQLLKVVNSLNWKLISILYKILGMLDTQKPLSYQQCCQQLYDTEDV